MPVVPEPSSLFKSTEITLKLISMQKYINRSFVSVKIHIRLYPFNPRHLRAILNLRLMARG
jgi:hypothetical protein